MGNIYEFSDWAAIEQEAREWLIRLDSETPLTDVEASALRDWLRRSPAHRQELKRISKFWDRANILTELAIPLREMEGHKTISVFSRVWLPVLGTRPIGAFMTVLLLSITVVLTSLLWTQRHDNLANGIYGTAVGQQQTLVLTDGSTVQINTDSQVQIDYSQQLRKIYLLRGEAHFDVAHNPDRPFEVFVGRSMVRAVGTAFSVYLKSNDVKVTVTEGRVNLLAVSSGPVAVTHDTSVDEPELEGFGFLQAGQTATFSQTSNKIERVELLAGQELQRLTSWQEGYLEFAGDPLSDVVAELNRYIPYTIRITGQKLKALPVGGRFKVGDLEAVFDVLKSSFGVQVVRLNDQDIQLQLRQDQ